MRAPKAPRCGAKTRRGTPCQASAVWSPKTKRYTRCRNHGGCSTGPRMPEGGALPPSELETRQIRAFHMTERPGSFGSPTGFEMRTHFGADPMADSDPMDNSGEAITQCRRRHLSGSGSRFFYLLLAPPATTGFQRLVPAPDPRRSFSVLIFAGHQIARRSMEVVRAMHSALGGFLVPVSEQNYLIS